MWSIALPGFGQYFKGTVLFILEFLIHVQANFNEVIILSFRGDISLAIQQTDYPWFMFYPYLYSFAMWDAFKDARGGKDRYSFLPFMFGAYFVTIGVIYSSLNCIKYLFLVCIRHPQGSNKGSNSLSYNEFELFLAH
ncbi:hypothetical protein [Priestia endophytica]|uniref:hypothetical protein n=1 Tax=Priestia endophytica TaxID=135735 RepID=UPI00384B2322